MATINLSDPTAAGRLEDGRMRFVIREPRRQKIHPGDPLYFFLQTPGRTYIRLFPSVEGKNRLPGRPFAAVCTAVMPLFLVIAPPYRDEGWYIAANIAPQRDYPTVGLDSNEIQVLAEAAGHGPGHPTARDQFAAAHYEHAHAAPGHLPGTGIRGVEVIWWEDPSSYGYTDSWWALKRQAAGGAPVQPPRPPKPRTFTPATTMLDGGGDALAIWRKQSRHRSQRPRFKPREISGGGGAYPGKTDPTPPGQGALV